MVDQVSKSTLTIPICIGRETSSPFPPRDRLIYQFLITDSPLDSKAYLKRTQALFFALFTVTLEELQKLAFGGRSKRKPVGAGLQNTNPDYELPDHRTMVTAATKLIDFVRARQPDDQSPLTLLLSFGEAHPLMLAKAYCTPFFEMQRSLRKLVGLPIFTLFLSTDVGLFYNFVPPFNGHLPGSGDRPRFYRPITAVNFDVVAHKVKLTEKPTLHKLASTDFINHLGRPLFGTRYDVGDAHSMFSLARTKLLCSWEFDA
ncbi:hypothetical protein ONZ45_g16036 [Pleurotus djamor]|nr:hypothetical protein ONZ45_g16036 [Pleurotus djamor]